MIGIADQRHDFNITAATAKLRSDPADDIDDIPFVGLIVRTGELKRSVVTGIIRVPDFTTVDPPVFCLEAQIRFYPAILQSAAGPVAEPHRVALHILPLQLGEHVDEIVGGQESGNVPVQLVHPPTCLEGQVAAVLRLRHGRSGKKEHQAEHEAASPPATTGRGTAIHESLPFLR